ncbi:MAG: hypothetical protein JXA54_05875 [Candidatus Heimdallarchaeota archaeon]|nr:hypothetical protein [Candidatus Heimdallarchaeota archaeon]
MKRNFLFILPDLDYQKNDLNVKESTSRLIIGQLARIITNTLFLSHSLRKEILILILVLMPKPHLYKISSESIRYLGPELRSSASIFLKTEKFIQEKLLVDEKQIFEKWFEPNPGLFVKLTNLSFTDFDENMHFIYIEPSNTSESQYMPLQRFDEFIITNYSNILARTFFVFSLIEDFSILQIFNLKCYEKNFVKINLANEISLPNISTIINLIIDKIEKNF